MATPVTLPALGESVTEGTVTRWLKQVGDEVAVDEPLLEVSTDKVDTEIPSPVAGTLLEIKVDEDETVEVGAELATIGDEGESGGSDDESGDSEESDDRRRLRRDRRVRRGPRGRRPEAGAEKADDDSDEDSDDDEDEDRKTETETDPPPAETDDEPAAQETAPASADTKPEAKASEKGASGKSDGTPVTLPALGECVTEGTVTRWLKKVGDEVAVDEPLLEVSTDKVDTEIPSPVAGTLLEIKVDEDETVEVGAELALIGSGDAGGSDDDEPDSSDPDDEPEQEDEPGRRSREATRRSRSPSRSPSRRRRSRSRRSPEEGSPRRRRLRRGAREAGRGGATGSGDGGPTSPRWCARWPPSTASTSSSIRQRRRRPHPQAGRARCGRGPEEGARRRQGGGEAGRRRSPREAAAAPVEPSPLRGKTEPMSRLRKVIAKRMVESLQVSAQLTTVVEVDVTSIARLRDSARQSSRPARASSCRSCRSSRRPPSTR